MSDLRHQIIFGERKRFFATTDDTPDENYDQYDYASPRDCAFLRLIAARVKYLQQKGELPWPNL
jgi:hypothetical protein